MLIVKKFGGSSVANKERIFNVARRCIEDVEHRPSVLVELEPLVQLHLARHARIVALHKDDAAVRLADLLL